MGRIAKPKVDLSTLPPYIIKVNGKWYRNMHTMAWIKKEHAANHIPKEIIEAKKDWIWNFYDN